LPAIDRGVFANNDVFGGIVEGVLCGGRMEGEHSGGARGFGFGRCLFFFFGARDKCQRGEGQGESIHRGLIRDKVFRPDTI